MLDNHVSKAHSLLDLKQFTNEPASNEEEPNRPVVRNSKVLKGSAEPRRRMEAHGNGTPSLSN